MKKFKNNVDIDSLKNEVDLQSKYIILKRDFHRFETTKSGREVYGVANGQFDMETAPKGQDPYAILAYRYRQITKEVYGFSDTELEFRLAEIQLEMNSLLEDFFSNNQISLNNFINVRSIVERDLENFSDDIKISKKDLAIGVQTIISELENAANVTKGSMKLFSDFMKNSDLLKKTVHGNTKYSKSQIQGSLKGAFNKFYGTSFELIVLNAIISHLDRAFAEKSLQLSGKDFFLQAGTSDSKSDFYAKIKKSNMTSAFGLSIKAYFGQGSTTSLVGSLRLNRLFGGKKEHQEDLRKIVFLAFNEAKEGVGFYYRQAATRTLADLIFLGYQNPPLSFIKVGYDEIAGVKKIKARFYFLHDLLNEFAAKKGNKPLPVIYFTQKKEGNYSNILHEAKIDATVYSEFFKFIDDRKQGVVS